MNGEGPSADPRDLKSSNLSDIPRLRAWYMAFFGPVEIWYFSIFYLSITLGFGLSVLSVLGLIASLMLYESWGVLLNDYFDREADRVAGKSGRERGHRLSPATMAGLVLSTAAVDWALILLLSPSAYYVAFWIFAYALGTMYSAPPFRLKNEGFLSFVCNSLLERPIPVVLVFLFFRYYGPEVVLFPVLSELVWSVFKHQVHDYDKDVAANLKTFAVMLGKERSVAIVRRVVNPLGVVSVVSFALAAAYRIPAYAWLFVSSAAVILAGVAVTLSMERASKVYSDPLDPPYILFLNLAFLIPLVLGMAAVAAVTAPTYLPVAVLFLLSLPPYLRYYGPMVTKVLRAP